MIVAKHLHLPPCCVVWASDYVMTVPFLFVQHSPEVMENAEKLMSNPMFAGIAK